eukprot:203347-Pyramimonas_sp.AAC.1
MQRAGFDELAHARAIANKNMMEPNYHGQQREQRAGHRSRGRAGRRRRTHSRLVLARHEHAIHERNQEYD